MNAPIAAARHHANTSPAVPTQVLETPSAGETTGPKRAAASQRPPVAPSAGTAVLAVPALNTTPHGGTR